MRKIINKLHFSFVELIWIFFSLIPTLIIIFINFLKPNHSLDLFVKINILPLLIFILLLFTLWLFKRYIDNKMKSKSQMNQVGNIENAKNNKEYMAFNFFAIYLLPVLSINLNNIAALILVLTLIVMISYKANLFYYNIFLFLFYDYEQVTISNKKYFIISKRQSSPVSDQENLYLIDEKIKLYIRYSGDKYIV